MGRNRMGFRTKRQTWWDSERSTIFLDI